MKTKNTTKASSIGPAVDTETQEIYLGMHGLSIMYGSAEKNNASARFDKSHTRCLLSKKFVKFWVSDKSGRENRNAIYNSHAMPINADEKAS